LPFLMTAKKYVPPAGRIASKNSVVVILPAPLSGKKRKAFDSVGRLSGAQ
jgi:hypothetical protein